MSKLTRKLREKLKQVSKRGMVLKERMFKGRQRRNASQGFGDFSFRQDKYEALEQVQQILGWTDEEISGLFGIMEKADDGHLNFHLRGPIKIAFWRAGFDETYPKAINVCVDVNGDEVTQSVKYTFYNGLGDLTSWKKRAR